MVRSDRPDGAQYTCGCDDVYGIPHDCGDVAIVDAIITMAHELGFSVVAEGVESEVQAGFLAGRHCDVLQGFHFHKPLRLSELNQLLKND